MVVEGRQMRQSGGRQWVKMQTELSSDSFPWSRGILGTQLLT